jgi:hypothetical protein
LRRRSLGGPNIGEACNSVKRAVFLHRLGEIRDRTLENQSHRANGLNLAVAAIILWNTVYIDQAVKALRCQARHIPGELLPHIAPPGWERVNLTGDYIWKSATASKRISLRTQRLAPEYLGAA